MKIRVIEYETVSSTSDLASSFARRGAKEGLVIKSDYQTKGRGRGRHRWHSPRGKDVLLTLLLRPRAGAINLSHFTVLACKSIAQFLRDYVEGVALKLPNDILVSGKKIAGVLVEGEMKGRVQKWVCIGVGINIQTDRDRIHRKGTSIYIEINRKLDVSKCFYEIISKLVENMLKFAN